MRGRKGLTLIEVLLALVVASTILLMARHLMSVATTALDRAKDDASPVDAAYVALRTLFLHASSGEFGALLGDENRLAFRSQCDAPGGWLEACDAELTIEQGDDGCSLHLSAGGSPVAIASRQPCGLRYLVTAAGGGEWASTWTDAAHRPVAVEVVAGGDTLIFRVGGRS
ncbi:MAG: prepilin-type N-terminal cleavage/methylation domain-containing protein [Gemmatimonadaceae bacterium]|nr:prepilin-type N-terminal cleavage/methylation domain-containing protein [Gemmatimonadaceae bacterium]